jgi:hypothetical protein
MKTTDLLTFFHPKKSTGSGWTFPLRQGDSLVAQFWVFTRGDVDLSRFANTTASTREELDALYKNLRDVIQPRGGLVVYAHDHNNVVKIQLSRVAASGYVPPGSMLRIKLFGDAQFETIKGNADLETGDHLLLPVSEDAEAQLSAFREDLKGLPSDQESSVLNVIRRPSLDWRIERIERTLSLSPATQAEQQRSRERKTSFLERLYDLVMRPIPIGPALVGVLLLSAGILYAHGRFAPAPNEDPDKALTSSSPGDPGETPPEQPAEPAPPTVETVKPTPGDLQASLDALFKALDASGDRSVKKFYESHFKGHQREAFKSSGISWGITKLQALQLGLVDKNHLMLNTTSAQTDAKNFYRDPQNIAALEKDKNALALLAYTWCQQSGRAEFPSTDVDSRTLSIPIGRTCADLKPEDAVPGLNALTDRVKSQPK